MCGWIRRIPGVSHSAPMRLAWLAAAAAVLGSGCQKRDAPSVRVENPFLGPMRVAVAPALNFSGSNDFDPNEVADIMASELSHVDGFEVLPVSRVLAILAGQGLTRVESSAHALQIKDWLGADAILVFGVTEYDPYEPPVVGISAELYGTRPLEAFSGIDPVLASRSPTPIGPAAGRGSGHELLGKFSGVFNAAHEPTADAVKSYARSRDSEESAFGWRKYTVSQQHYLRFCCHTTIKRMLLEEVRP